uniref:Uncharacterized protein n=1 Tax=uncultured bacterium 5H7 TaxID=1701327 RepID=A0A166H1H1_9BACT|nr:hypothetical protein 5H7_017 [uncultured bacterium 5H7]
MSGLLTAMTDDTAGTPIYMNCTVSIKTRFLRLLYCLVTIASVTHPIPSRTRP